MKAQPAKRASYTSARQRPYKQPPKRQYSPWLLVLLSSLCILVVWLFAQLTARTISQVDTAEKAPQPAIWRQGGVQRNIAYCNDRQHLDIYHPRQRRYRAAPVVIYMHGGGWEINNKASEPDQLALVDGLRDRGYAVVSIDYRKMPADYYPAPVADALCAVRFLRAKSGEYGLDGKRFSVYGFSSGAYLAAMVGVLDSDSTFNRGPYKTTSSRVQAVVTLAGLFSFEAALSQANNARIAQFLQARSTNEAQPVTYVTADDPPFFMVHGRFDERILLEQDSQLAVKLEEARVRYRQTIVENADHGLNQVGGEAITPTKESVRQDMQQFIEQNLNTGGN